MYECDYCGDKFTKLKLREAHLFVCDAKRRSNRAHPPILERLENGMKLGKAAANSYSKHCGPKSIELAEGDLLGELIQFAEEALHIMECHAEFNETFAVKRGKEILAKLPRTQE